MSSGGDGTNKRRKVSSTCPPCSIYDLPHGALANTASFLAEPSRALFAVALRRLSHNNNNIFQDDATSAIVGDGSTVLDTLDFGDWDRDLATKLSDDDVSGVLHCIDAVNKLKRLKLSNCINISGAGLEPLRGSIIIEQIDLSLVKEHQNSDLYSNPSISRDSVLPILDSIIERGEDCSLRHLHFPVAWREDRNSAGFHAFLRRYNQLMEIIGVSCLKCNRSLPTSDDDFPFISAMGVDIEVIGSVARYDYGTQKHTCYNCLNHYCNNCRKDEFENEYYRKYPLNRQFNLNVGFQIQTPREYLCNICDRAYCHNCQTGSMCQNSLCNAYSCTECMEFLVSQRAPETDRRFHCEFACNRCDYKSTVFTPDDDTSESEESL